MVPIGYKGSEKENEPLETHLPWRALYIIIVTIVEI